MNNIETEAEVRLPVSEKYLLSIRESAAYFNIGIKKMRIITNNPVKRVGLEAYGIEIVDNVPIEVTPNPYNERYLRTKQTRMGHTLHL